MNLIDRDALVAKLEITEGCSECKWVNGSYCKRYKTFVDACQAIFEAPVIEQPEIIYCKDCKHWKVSQNNTCGIQICHLFSGVRGEYDFCSRGEKA